jgi:hypothetical protein
MSGLHQLIDLERNWVKKGLGNTLYIRPFMIAIGSGVIAATFDTISFYDYSFTCKILLFW